MSSQVISFNCLLKNKAGRLISSTFNRDVLNSSEKNSDLLLGLAQGLQNLKKGELRKISVSAEEAYGLYDPKKVILFPKKKIPFQTKIGETVSIAGKSGTLRTYTVLEFHDDLVSLDGNHPLAGQDLIFEVEVLEARQATEYELEGSQTVLKRPLLN